MQNLLQKLVVEGTTIITSLCTLERIYPKALTSPTTREAITDALYRAVTCCDRCDIPTLDSAWAREDVVVQRRGEDRKVVS